MGYYNNQLDRPDITAPLVQSADKVSLPPPKIKFGWFFAMIFLLILVTVIIISFVVYQEISARNAKLKNFLQSAQNETALTLAENKLLSNMAGGVIIGSSTVVSQPTSSATISGISNVSPDKNRQLAEKSGRPEFGNASSSLVIVEFADFECAICREEFAIIRSITNKYAKDVKFIFRNYPVIDQNSLMLAQAGLCAQEQGKFWSFHDRLYANQGQMTNLADFKKVAVMSGLDWNKLQDCVNNDKYKSQVMEDMQDAIDLGAQGTPTFFINGKRLAGAVDEKTWEDIIAKYKELNK